MRSKNTLSVVQQFSEPALPSLPIDWNIYSNVKITSPVVSLSAVSPDFAWTLRTTLISQSRAQCDIFQPNWLCRPVTDCTCPPCDDLDMMAQAQPVTPKSDLQAERESRFARSLRSFRWPNSSLYGRSSHNDIQEMYDMWRNVSKVSDLNMHHRRVLCELTQHRHEFREAFRSLFQSWHRFRTPNIGMDDEGCTLLPYFYLITYRWASIWLNSDCVVLTRSSNRIRRLLEDESIAFTMPLCVVRSDPIDWTSQSLLVIQGAINCRALYNVIFSAAVTLLDSPFETLLPWSEPVPMLLCGRPFLHCCDNNARVTRNISSSPSSASPSIELDSQPHHSLQIDGILLPHQIQQISSVFRCTQPTGITITATSVSSIGDQAWPSLVSLCELRSLQSHVAALGDQPWHHSSAADGAISGKSMVITCDEHAWTISFK